MEKFFETESISLGWDDKNNWVYSNWLKNPSPEQYKEGLEKALELIIKKNAKGWLANIVNLGIVSNELQAWILEKWTPRLIQTPIKKTAMVISKNILSKMSVDQMLVRSKNNAENKYFGSEEDAAQWLKS